MEELSRREKIKILLTIIVTIVVEVTFYFIADLFGYRAHLLTPGFIDNLIPFKTYFVYLYMFWYVMLFLVPYILGVKDDPQFKKYIKSIYICLIIALSIFIIYPTVMERPELIVNNFSDKILSILFAIGTPTKCSPSMHVALSSLFILATTTSKKVRKPYKIFVILASIGIIISTMFVKEHYFIDIVTGVLVGTIAWILTKIDFKKVVKK